MRRMQPPGADLPGRGLELASWSAERLAGDRAGLTLADIAKHRVGLVPSGPWSEGQIDPICRFFRALRGSGGEEDATAEQIEAGPTEGLAFRAALQVVFFASGRVARKLMVSG